MTDFRSLHYFWWVTGYVAAYVILDLLCGPPLQYRPIYPVWHPAAGLAVFMMLRQGKRALLPLCIAIVVSSLLVPILSGRLAVSILIGLLPLPAYAGIAWFMRRYLDRGEFLANHRGVLLWVGCITLAMLTSSVLYASMVMGLPMLGSTVWLTTLFRYGVAEIAGILAIVPLLYFLADRDLRWDFLDKILDWESVAGAVLIALVLWAALQRPPSESLVYYLLFLPIAWAAARQGTAGAIASALTLEVGITVASLMPGPHAAQMSDVQMLVLTLILAGFLIGVAVDVARRASSELRLSLRLAAAGEMAGALAHELNQPLTALSAYGSACARLVERDGGDPLLKKTVGSIVAEAQRASNVLKRLREFFRTGSTQLEQVSLIDLIKRVSNSFVEQATTEQVNLTVLKIPSITILADHVQLEIVLRNLLANAFQVLAQQPAESFRSITIDAGADDCWVWIRIADNGPGIANKIRARLFDPFISTKSSGLGLGLVISRSIVETHGGVLSVDPSPHGVFRITLPIAKNAEELPDDD